MKPLFADNTDAALQTAGALGGLVILLIAVGALILTVLWIVLPLILMGKLNRMIRLLEEHGQSLRVAAHNSASSGEILVKIESNTRTDQPPVMAEPAAEPISAPRYRFRDDPATKDTP